MAALITIRLDDAQGTLRHMNGTVHLRIREHVRTHLSGTNKTRIR